MWFSFPIRPLFHSGHGWLGCFGLHCHICLWGPTQPRRWRLVPGLQLRGTSHSSTVVLEWSGFGCWVEVCLQGSLGEEHGEKLWGVRAEVGQRAVVLRQGPQAAPSPSQQLFLPTKTLSQTMKGVTVVWLKNKVMGKQRNFLNFV